MNLLTSAGAGIGYILPSFYECARSFWENHGEALILPAKDTHTIMYAYQEMKLALNPGDPTAEPPPMTKKAYVERYHCCSVETYVSEMAT